MLGFIYRVLEGGTQKTTEYMSVKFGENMTGDIKVPHVLYPSTLLVMFLMPGLYPPFLVVCFYARMTCVSSCRP